MDRDGLPDGGSTIALIRSGPGPPAGIDTGIRLVTPDARAGHVVRSLGLDASELLEWDTAPLMCPIVDDDGNRFYVTEAPSSSTPPRSRPVST